MWREAGHGPSPSPTPPLCANPRILSLPVPEFVFLVDRFGLAIRTFALETRRRELWLLGKKIVSQRLAYLGMSENLAALFAR